jgi:hypothetical protein
MADAERLELTLRNRGTDRNWTGHRVEVTEDPTDHAPILKRLAELARDLEGYRGDDMSGYEVRVRSLDQEWRKPFTVVGRSQ